MFDATRMEMIKTVILEAQTPIFCWCQQMVFVTYIAWTMGAEEEFQDNFR